MSTRGPNITGSDPITVIDPKHHTAVHFSLNYHVSSGIPAVNGDVVASVSTDGGLDLAGACRGRSRPRRGVVLDKEDATVDIDPASPHYGRMYVTWTGFVGDAKRADASPIVMAYSDDGGPPGRRPHEISGSNARTAPSRPTVRRGSATRTSSPTPWWLRTASSTSRSRTASTGCLGAG